MYSTILAAVDLTDNSQAIVKKATLLAKKHHATLLICHVSEVAYIDGGYESYLYTGFDMQNHTVDKEKMEELKKLANNLGLSDVLTLVTTSTSVSGSLVYEVSEDYGVDLIVIGSSQNKKVKHFLLGNVASNVSKNAKCDVFIIKNKNAD